MQPLRHLACLALVHGLALTSSPANPDANAAPYFQIIGNHDESSVEALPLKSSAAKVTIDGTIARVTLTQHYANSGQVPIEALYVFPASTRAAVHGMTLTSGGRVIAARIRESAAAKAEYETAKKERKTAALLEERRPNVFQMAVANLLPGADIRVEVTWSESIPALEGTYEFVFPTVVGPRYTGGTGGSSDACSETWTANPYLTEGTAPPATLSVDVALATALPLLEVASPSHPSAVSFQGKDRATIKLDTRAGETAADRDFILRWKLGGAQVDAGLLLHQGESLNHFLLQIEPPQRVTAEQVPPRDYVMVLDVSGSMTGFPLDTAKALLRDLVRGLKPTDTFNVVCFASGSGLLAEDPLPATPANLEVATEFISNQTAGGGTELAAALQRALALPGGDDRSRSLLLITDGYVAADNQVRELVRRNIGSANLFAFGIGTAVNRELIEATARAGGGEPSVVTSAAEAAPAARRFLQAIANPVLAKIRIEGEGITLGQVTPSPCADVFASRPLIINGTFSGAPAGAIIVRGIAGDGAPFAKRIDLAQAAADRGVDHPALPVLWARERVRDLTEQADPAAATIKEITGLGLTYSLLTPYTSFVAVDETPRELTQAAIPVKQPLPLPQGVTAAAIGSTQAGPLVRNGSVPEPSGIALIALLIMLLAMQRGR
jgi:Ca-activated chloride channel family protein